jgi:hypothetical protein
VCPLATLALPTICPQSWSTCAWVLPCASQYFVTFSYQSLSLSSMVSLPLNRGPARSSQPRGSSPALMSLVFQAGSMMLNRVAVQSSNRPVLSTLSSAGPWNRASSPRLAIVAISRKLVSTTSFPVFLASLSWNSRWSTVSEPPRNTLTFTPVCWVNVLTTSPTTSSVSEV